MGLLEEGRGWLTLSWGWAEPKFCGSFRFTQFTTSFKSFKAGAGLVLESLGHKLWWDLGEFFCLTAEPPAFWTIRDIFLLSVPTASCSGYLGRFRSPALPLCTLSVLLKSSPALWSSTALHAVEASSALEEFLSVSLPSHLLWWVTALHLWEVFYIFRRMAPLSCCPSLWHTTYGAQNNSPSKMSTS